MATTYTGTITLPATTMAMPDCTTMHQFTSALVFSTQPIVWASGVTPPSDISTSTIADIIKGGNYTITQNLTVNIVGTFYHECTGDTKITVEPYGTAPTGALQATVYDSTVTAPTSTSITAPAYTWSNIPTTDVNYQIQSANVSTLTCTWYMTFTITPVAKKGLSKGLIIGLSVGAAIFFLIFIIVLIVIMRR